MSNFLYYLAAFALVLGVLIIVHEYGHYLVARCAGVKVLRFSVGFGRVLWSKRIGRDGTEWAISLFPLGGYVKMLDEREGDVAPEELHRSFNQQSVWRRMAIVAAGPLANLVLAVVVYWGIFLSGTESATDTFKVAKAFGKGHKDVMRKTRKVISSCSPDFAERNFTLCHENNELQNGKPQKFYQMTKDGFMFLVMGYTGEKAALLKEAYINAFNWMYKQFSHGKDKLIRELQETIQLERISFQNGSNAGKALNLRKLEKKKLRDHLMRIEKELGQPDLFIAA